MGAVRIEIPLHELKVADLWDDEKLGDIFTDYEMVKMVTSGAALATNWQNGVGTIAPGMVATSSWLTTLHQSLPQPDQRWTQMCASPSLVVWLYTAMTMAALKGDDREPAGMYGKAVDVTFLAVSEGAQTCMSITEDLTMAMQSDIEKCEQLPGCQRL